MNESISKVEFVGTYPHVLVKIYCGGNYYYEDAQYCKSLEEVNKFVQGWIKRRGVAIFYPPKPTVKTKPKVDFHEKARIEQFMIETGSTPAKQNAAFKAKVIGRAEKCSDSKKLAFASTLRWFGMEKLADTVELMV
jgi:hypothetical protein